MSAGNTSGCNKYYSYLLYEAAIKRRNGNQHIDNFLSCFWQTHFIPIGNTKIQQTNICNCNKQFIYETKFKRYKSDLFWQSTPLSLLFLPLMMYEIWHSKTFFISPRRQLMSRCRLKNCVFFDCNLNFASQTKTFNFIFLFLISSLSQME